MPELVFIQHVPTHAISAGFIPAARRLGLKTTILTDCLEAQQKDFAALPPEQGPDRLLPCNVFNPVSIIDCICDNEVSADAIFSNSDHLQTATAMAASFFGLPHKNIRACYLAKHKGQMRDELARHGVETIWHRLFPERASLDAATDLRFPSVAKPCKGVASQQVKYIGDHAALLAFADIFWKKTPEMPMLLEEYLPGTIYSLETLGDAQTCHYLGGFTCSLTPLPYFIETGARWGLEEAGPQAIDYVLNALRSIGATFGACHTEFVMSPQGPRMIEVNYRSIGDQSDFQLSNMMGGTYFEQVLRAQLGETLNLPAIDPQGYTVARYLFSERAGVIADIPQGFVEEREGCAVHYVPVKHPGDSLELSNSNKDYLAMIHVTGSGRDHVESVLEGQIRAVEEAIRWQ